MTTKIADQEYRVMAYMVLRTQGAAAISEKELMEAGKTDFFKMPVKDMRKYLGTLMVKNVDDFIKRVEAEDKAKKAKKPKKK